MCVSSMRTVIKMGTLPIPYYDFAKNLKCNIIIIYTDEHFA